MTPRNSLNRVVENPRMRAISTHNSRDTHKKRTSEPVTQLDGCMMRRFTIRCVSHCGHELVR